MMIWSMHNHMLLVLLLGGILNNKVECTTVSAQLGAGPWANQPICQCPVGSSSSSIKHPVNANWDVRIILNDPNLVASSTGLGYRGMDALRCPSGQVSNTPGPVGSCGAYNYISPPKAEAWLTVFSPTTPLGSDDRIVVTDVLPFGAGSNPFVVRRMILKVKHASVVYVDLYHSGTKLGTCVNDIPNPGAWTKVRCDFCSILAPIATDVNRVEIRFGQATPWNTVGVKKLRIKACEF